MASTVRSGPLEDLTIIDCTMAYAGPFGTNLLADMGANVIKVEPPSGDGFRMVAPHPPNYTRVGKPQGEECADYGASFASVNGNKRSICLDLKLDADKQVLMSLCDKADAIVENMRAGVMDRLGVGYEALAARNPRLVYATVRGYGDPRTGASPYADWPCLDPAGQAAGGLVEANGELVGVAMADIYPGTLMALGLLAAVHRAQRTGQGDFVDVAMIDAVQTLVKTNVAAYGLTGREPRPGVRALMPFGLFPTTDGRIAIAAPVERHWRSLCEIMGREELAADERSSSNPRRVENRDFVEGVIAAWTQTKTKAEVLQLLGGKVPCGPANTIGELVNDEHCVVRDMVREFDYPGDNPSGLLSGSAIKFASGATGLYQRPPKHGEHTDEVLAEYDIER
jgi:crotonobetainyl-CoA:carnitine CoA-transferase CaiB-like acyl-CoA transferase